MKLMQVLKNRKGFTLMELIVVLIIIAILMAALLPSLIGWINESRESALRVEGRTALLAIQSVVTEAAGTGFWSDTARTPYGGVNWTRVNADQKFQSLMQDARIYGSTAAAFVAPNRAAPATGINTIRLDAASPGGVPIGLWINNTIRPLRNVDGVGDGFLLVGQTSAFPAP